MHPGFHVLLPIVFASVLVHTTTISGPGLLEKNMIMSLSCFSRKQCHHIVLKIRLSLFGLPCGAPQEYTLLTLPSESSPSPPPFLHISSCPECLSGLCFLLSLGHHHLLSLGVCLLLPFCVPFCFLSDSVLLLSLQVSLQNSLSIFS